MKRNRAGLSAVACSVVFGFAPLLSSAPATTQSTASAAVVAPAQPTTLPTEAAAKVDAVIKRLSDDSWQVRQNAQDELSEMGPAVEQRLREVLKQTHDEEVRTRIEAALRQIDENRLNGPSYITIHLKNVPPRDVFAELSRQASAEIRPNPRNLWEMRSWPAVDIDIEHKPFWLAVREICSKVGVVPQVNGNEHEMVIMDHNAGRGWGDAPVVVSGPFMVVATSISRSNYVNLNQPQNIGRNCSMQMTVYVEPKMRVLQYTIGAKISEAIDNKGNSLLSQRNFGDMMQPVTGWALNMSAGLMPPPNSGDRLSLLKGSARFLVQSRSERAEVADLLSVHDHQMIVAGRKCIVKEIRKNGDSYNTQISIFRTGWGQNEWVYGLPYTTFRMVDARGLPLMRLNSRIMTNQNQTVVEFQFQRLNWNGGENAGEPAKLIWEVPTETREVVVPFEFKDLPLP